jgi:hypothetical protein
MSSPNRWTLSLIGLFIICYMTAGQPVHAQDPSDGDERATVLVHVVQPGDTLDSIAQLYAVSSQTLLDANGLSSAVDVYIGQRLVIPQLDSGDEQRSNHGWPR